MGSLLEASHSKCGLRSGVTAALAGETSTGTDGSGSSLLLAKAVAALKAEKTDASRAAAINILNIHPHAGDESRLGNVKVCGVKKFKFSIVSLLLRELCSLSL